MNVLDGARETLVLLGIVILETNLEVNGLHEFSWLGLLGVLDGFTDALIESFLGNFACPVGKMDMIF